MNEIPPLNEIFPFVFTKKDFVQYSTPYGGYVPVERNPLGGRGEPMNGVLQAIRRHCFKCPHPRACRPCVYATYRRTELIEKRNGWLLLQAFGERLEDAAGEAKEAEG